MSQSGYTAWNVTAGEVPTTAYWNILGSNDASFNTGNGFNDGIIQNRHLSSTMISTGITTYTNPGSAGGTFFYSNIGGKKELWGVTNSIAVGNAPSTASTIVTFPSGFFTTVQMCVGMPTAVGGTNFIYVNSLYSVTNVQATLELQTSTGGGSAYIYVYVIGT